MMMLHSPVSCGDLFSVLLVNFWAWQKAQSCDDDMPAHTGNKLHTVAIMENHGICRVLEVLRPVCCLNDFPFQCLPDDEVENEEEEEFDESCCCQMVFPLVTGGRRRRRTDGRQVLIGVLLLLLLLLHQERKTRVFQRQF